MNLPKKVLANILLEGFGEEYEGESLLKSSEFGDGAYTCQENMIVIRRNRNTKTVAHGMRVFKLIQLSYISFCEVNTLSKNAKHNHIRVYTSM